MLGNCPTSNLFSGLNIETLNVFERFILFSTLCVLCVGTCMSLQVPMQAMGFRSPGVGDMGSDYNRGKLPYVGAGN